jgi:hypothetical protein
MDFSQTIDCITGDELDDIPQCIRSMQSRGVTQLGSAKAIGVTCISAVRMVLPY